MEMPKRKVFVYPKEDFITDQEARTIDQLPQRAVSSWSLEASMQRSTTVFSQQSTYFE